MVHIVHLASQKKQKRMKKIFFLLAKDRHHHNSVNMVLRLKKTNTLASANPSVQVNTHEKVLFRGAGRRPWLKYLQEEEAEETQNNGETHNSA